MTATSRTSSVILLLTLLVGCDAGITSPSPARVPTPTFAIPEPVVSAELSGPSRTFAFVREGRFPVSDYTRRSRFVLYDTGAFVLEYPGMRGYGGKYRVLDGAIDLQWADSNTGGAYESTSSFDGVTLVVQYGFIMNMGGFEDAVYTLQH